MKCVRMSLSLVLVTLAFAAAGCGGTAEEPSVGSMVDKAAADAQDAAETTAYQGGEAAEEGAADVQEAAGSAMDDVAGMAEKGKEELAAKEAELARVSEEIKQLSPQDLLTDNGKKLQAQAESLMAEIEELKGKL